MDAGQVVTIARQTIWVIVKTSVPILLVSMIVGLIISLFQTRNNNILADNSHKSKYYFQDFSDIFQSRFIFAFFCYLQQNKLYPASRHSMTHRTVTNVLGKSMAITSPIAIPNSANPTTRFIFLSTLLL